jgi:hypothetical protein
MKKKFLFLIALMSLTQVTKPVFGGGYFSGIAYSISSFCRQCVNEHPFITGGVIIAAAYYLWTGPAQIRLEHLKTPYLSHKTLF